MPIHTSFNPNGRQELKFGITYMDYMQLRNKLKHFMRIDPNAGPTGKFYLDENEETEQLSTMNRNGNIPPAQ